jgi:hypothetical protein
MNWYFVGLERRRKIGKSIKNDRIVQKRAAFGLE